MLTENQIQADIKEHLKNKYKGQRIYAGKNVPVDNRQLIGIDTVIEEISNFCQDKYLELVPNPDIKVEVVNKGFVIHMKVPKQ